MIKSLLKLALLLIAGILVYNYFLGTESEKQNSQKIFSEIKDVGVEVGNLIKSEKEKFDEGKYDDALEKMKGVYDNLKEKAKYIDEKYISQLDDLDRRRNDLEERLDEVTSDTTDEGKKQRKDLQKDLDKLLDETEDLIKNIKLKE